MSYRDTDYRWRGGDRHRAVYTPGRYFSSGLYENHTIEPVSVKSFLYPRSHSYSAANEQRVGSYIRDLMCSQQHIVERVTLTLKPSNTDYESFGSAPSSMLSSLSYRTQPFADISYNPTPDANEVYPGIFVGDAVAAKDKAWLRRMGINYVLNTAEGKRYTQVDTDHLYYRDCPTIHYKGFQLMDLPSTDISKYFYIAANFIDEALTRGGRVLVHCFMGVSRSATCAIAFLMIKRGMSLAEALATVRTRRDVYPNEGFLRQLQQLDRELRSSRVR